MRTDEWLVLVVGVAIVAWINWYFFVASRRGPSLPTGERSRD